MTNRGRPIHQLNMYITNSNAAHCQVNTQRTKASEVLVSDYEMSAAVSLCLHSGVLLRMCAGCLRSTLRELRAEQRVAIGLPMEGHGQADGGAPGR